jgi:hypothetical protein
MNWRPRPRKSLAVSMTGPWQRTERVERGRATGKPGLCSRATPSIHQRKLTVIVVTAWNMTIMWRLGLTRARNTASLRRGLRNDFSVCRRRCSRRRRIAGAGFRHSDQGHDVRQRHAAVEHDVVVLVADPGRARVRRSRIERLGARARARWRCARRSAHSAGAASAAAARVAARARSADRSGCAPARRGAVTVRSATVCVRRAAAMGGRGRGA